MKLVSTAIFVCTWITLSFSQTSFQKNLDIFLESPLISIAADGQSFFVADVFNKNSVNRMHVYKLDSQGNILWHYEQTGTDLTLQLMSLKVVQGGVVLLLNTNSTAQSNGYILKLNADGSSAWDRTIGKENFTQLFDIQEDAYNDIWLSGLHLPSASNDSSYHFLSKLSSAGIPIASIQNYYRYFNHTGYEQCRFTDLTWDVSRNRLTFVHDFENIYSHSSISEPNRGRTAIGYCEGNFSFDEKFLFYQISSLKSSDTCLFFSGWTVKGNLARDKPVIGIIDSTGKNATVVKMTPVVYQPVRSYSGDIVFYNPQEKMLIKYDASLNPVWARKLDNCTITTAFQSEIDQNGNIYSVRNIDLKTVVAKALPDGSLNACISYHQSPPVLENAAISDWLSYYPTGYFHVAVTDTLHHFNLNSSTSISKDFCIKMDAAFSLPDTLCLGSEIVPMEIDTTEGIRHTWDLGTLRSEDSIPSFSLSSPGIYKMFHSVENNICRDTASLFVQVIQNPEILLGDTLLCGPANLMLDLNHAGASRYYLNDTPTSPLIDIKTDGLYTIRLENDACFVEKDIQVRIVEFEPPVTVQDSIWCFGAPVQVALRNDFDQVFWDHQPVADSFIIRDDAQHLYQARYKPDTTCRVEGYYSVPRKKCAANQEDIFIPNVFSPNGDGSNDVFLVFPKAVARIQAMKIFNRWGSLVYAYAGETPGWDGSIKGQLAAPGVYTYWVKYLDVSNNTTQVQAGDVLLLR